MATRPTKAADDGPLNIVRLVVGQLDAFVIGITPLIQNRMAAKATRSLLLPSGRKTAAEKAGTLKHEPISEYRDSVYRLAEGPTLIGMPAPAFKGAMRTAALEIPGVARTSVDRLIWVEGNVVSVFGVPKLRSDVVRMADIAKTPDLRFRACLWPWACKITINHVMPRINATAAGNLLAGGGMVAGVGDYRQEKGKGNFGQFEVIAADDPRLRDIVENGSRAAQVAALHEPVFWDAESEELVGWYDQEITRRGHKAVVAALRERIDGRDDIEEVSAL